MSVSLVALTQRLIEGWVRLYTLGLPAAQRRQRLALICADVFAQMEEARDEGSRPIPLIASLLSRSIRGLPADVTWRLFEARRLRPPLSAQILERRPSMVARSPGLAFLAAAAMLAWVLVLLLAIVTPAHSLAYAGGLLVLLALSAWVLEARASADDEPAPSAWPLLVAMGTTSVGLGAVFHGGAPGLVFSVLVALGFSAALLRNVAARRVAEERDGVRPVDSREMMRHAVQGDVIAIETRTPKGVTRRALLRSSFGLGVATGLAAMGGVVADFLWQRNVSGFGGIVNAGNVAEFPPGSKTKVREGKFWLVNLTEAQGGPGFLALWQKCPHLGCIVPWEPRFSYVHPETGERKEGWFRCPCHQSTYDDAGVRVYGPAPRSLDRMALRVTESGTIEVDTSDISKGANDNAAYAVDAASTQA